MLQNLFKNTQKTLFITVIILLDNFILIYGRPTTFTEISFFFQFWCSVSLFLFSLKPFLNSLFKLLCQEFTNFFAEVLYSICTNF